MAFGNNTIWQVQQDGSDTANGGGFNAGNSNMAGDLAATSANTASPVVTSASYNFVSRDEGHWLFIKSGTNWLAGWYQIASTSSNAATLSAAAGAGVLVKNTKYPETVTTATGCATTASPTSGTWTIDYSQAASAGIAFTDMVIDGTTNTKFTSSGNPVGKNMIGNIISVTSGTGFTVQRVEVVSTATTTATCDKSLGTLSSTGGNGGLGGGFATPGGASSVAIGGNMIMIKGNVSDTPFTQTSTSANVAGGRLGTFSGSGTSDPSYVVGYYTTRTFSNTDSTHLPILRAGINSGIAVLAHTSLYVYNLNFDNPSAYTSCYAIQVDSNYNSIKNVSITGYARGIDITGSRTVFTDVSAVSCTYGFYINSATNCAFIACTCKDCGDSFYNIGFRDVLYACSAENTTTGHAFTLIQGPTLIGCVAYKTATGKDGFNIATSGQADPSILINCLAHTCGGSTGYGFNNGTGPGLGERLLNCAGYSNGSGGTTHLSTGITAYPTTNIGFVACTSDPLNNVASHDFTLASGSQLLNAGWPTSFKNVVGTNYPNIGMFTNQVTSGSSVVGWNPFMEVMGA